jgi:Fe-S-cluster containining protein
MVVLTDDDEPALYPEAVELPFPNPFGTGLTTWRIPFGRDGACVYLGPRGCTIYARRPKMCRVFSCVGFVERWFAQTGKAERRRALRGGAIDRDVIRAGLARQKKVAVEP